MLGASILLKGENEIRNRLLVYLNVFIFSYSFESYIRNLSITPILLEFSIIERVVLALVPCTVILFVFSLLGSGQVLRRICDGVGALLAALVLCLVSQVHPYFPWNQSITISLFDVGLFGKAFFAVLLVPLALDLVYSASKNSLHIHGQTSQIDTRKKADSILAKNQGLAWFLAILAGGLVLELLSRKRKARASDPS
jgi:uncharacterized membrane protein